MREVFANSKVVFILNVWASQVALNASNQHTVHLKLPKCYMLDDIFKVQNKKSRLP